MHMPTNQDPFEALHAQSLRMVAAAQANDWDRLAEIEREMAQLRDHILAQQGNADASPTLDPATARRKAELIAAMLAHDAEVRRHVEPWLASARKLLTSNKRGRAARAAYAAHAPK